MTRLNVPVTFNFRAVAGTKPGTLYRADALATLNRDGRAVLRELQVGRILDLRSDLDRKLGGRDRLWRVGAELVKAPMMPGAKKSEIYNLTLERLYRTMLDSNGAAIGLAVRHIADAPAGAVVVHCTAGKDRTGIVSALIQLAIGFDETTVIDDYALTQANLEGEWADRMRRRMKRLRVELTPQLDQVLVGSPPDALEAALDYVKAEHGGVAAYLAKVGVTDATLERLHDRLVDPVGEKTEEDPISLAG